MTFWLVALALSVGPVALIARFAWPARRRTGVAVIAGLAGSVVGLFGLLALLFNGYVEDFGSPPAETLGLAAALLCEATLLYALAWVVATRRSAQLLAVAVGVGALGCAALLVNPPLGF